MKAGLLLALALVVAAACTRTPLAGPHISASSAIAVCTNMAKLGCAVGSDPDCPHRVALGVTEQHTTPAAVACASSAPTVPALEACADFFACVPVYAVPMERFDP